MQKTITIDVTEMKEFLSTEMKKVRQATETDAEEFAKDTGMKPQAFLGIDSIDDAQDSFCDLWPEVRKLVKYAGWIPGLGGILAKARIVLAWVDKKVVPQICAAEGKQAGTVTKNFNN